MKLIAKSVLGLLVAGLFVGGLAQAAEQFDQTAQRPAKSHWYCVSEEPGGMQSSGHIGYGHGQSRAESAARAVDACRQDGGFACGEAQCFAE